MPVSVTDIFELGKFYKKWPLPDAEKEICRSFTAQEFVQNIEPTPVKYGVFVQTVNCCPEEAGKLDVRVTSLYVPSQHHSVGMSVVYSPM